MIIRYVKVDDGMFIIYSEGRAIPLVAEYGGNKLELISNRKIIQCTVDSQVLPIFNSAVHKGFADYFHEVGRSMFYGSEDDLKDLIKKVNNKLINGGVFINHNNVTMSRCFITNGKMANIGKFLYRCKGARELPLTIKDDDNKYSIRNTYEEITDDVLDLVIKDSDKYSVKFVFNIKGTSMVLEDVTSMIISIIHQKII